MYSGCEMVNHVLKDICLVLLSFCSIKLDLQFVWQCEKDLDKLSFLRAQFPEVPHRFNEAEQVGRCPQSQHDTQ